jgi:hypothetical protein
MRFMCILRIKLVKVYKNLGLYNAWSDANPKYWGKQKLLTSSVITYTWWVY